VTPQTKAPDNVSLNPGQSHKTTLVSLALLTLVSGFAAQGVTAINPEDFLPWVVAFALIVAWTFRRPRELDLFEPVTYLTWIHYAPAFVVGSGMLAVGYTRYPYAGLVGNPIAACALALSYIGIGYMALRLGSRWRGARALGDRLAPLWPSPSRERTIPLVAIVGVIALGLAANYGAFRAGVIGFAVPRPPGPLDAAVSYAGLLMALGHFLFWFRWFAPEQQRPSRVALIIPVLVVVVSMVIMGNRGALLLSYLHALMAYRLARGRMTLVQTVVAVLFAFVALGIGMTYGSLFRSLRGGESGSAAAVARDAAAAPRSSESNAASSARPPASTAPAVPRSTAPPPQAQPSLGRHLQVAAEAATTLIQNPNTTPVSRILKLVGQRLNLVADASVSIARYPTLRPLEAEHGISDMWTMTWTGFVPRLLWPNKPKVSDARAYSALYFNYGGNSYATTPPVDLIRNVGPFGMPLGMALFGVVLGVLSTALLTPHSAGRAERAALFALLLVNINLEGSFGLLLPTMFRVGLVVVIGLVMVRLFSVRPRSWRAQ
jgi:hypothetical protein